MAKCLRGKRQAERQYSASVKYQCWKGEVQNRDIHGPKINQSNNFKIDKYYY